jgi:pimeloyl-ACP methyl ester carboxylesterase
MVDFLHEANMENETSGTMTSEPGFSDRFYTSTDGLKLHVRVYGERIDSPTPVVCLPGLTRNARDFHELAIHLSQEAESPRKVIAFDYRGRGRSAYDRDWHNYNVVVEAGDVIAGLISVGVENGHFIGTSRGGLIIHVLGEMRPALLKSVVLNDVGPVLEGEGLAHIRSYLTRAPKPASLTDAIAVQRTAHGAAFSALDDADWMRFTAAIYREQSGRPERDFDPALLKTVKGFNLNRPLPEIWQQFAGLCGVPLLVIRGENSKLLSPATLAEMARRHPNCETVTVQGQGHAPLLETGTLPNLIEAFFERADRQQ